MSAEDLQRLEDWLIQNGAKFPNLRLQTHAEEMRGVHTDTDLAADAVIVEVRTHSWWCSLHAPRQTDARSCLYMISHRYR